MRSLLNEYKELSKRLLNALKEEKIEEVFKLSEERQKILYTLSGMPIDKSIDLEQEYNIYSIDEEISNEINKQKVNIKIEMEENKRKKAANSVYGRQFENIYFINKQI